jgi:DNA repair protein RadC
MFKYLISVNNFLIYQFIYFLIYFVKRNIIFLFLNEQNSMISKKHIQNGDIFFSYIIILFMNID